MSFERFEGEDVTLSPAELAGSRVTRLALEFPELEEAPEVLGLELEYRLEGLTFIAQFVEHNRNGAAVMLRLARAKKEPNDDSV